jgi:nucleoside-diphosphate-sugar epimerase
VTTLITGGAGFVGSHLVDSCVQRGEHVIVMDNLSTGNLRNLERALKTGRATFVYCDVATTVDRLREEILSVSKEPLGQIYHLASPASPEAYNANPWETLTVNGIGTMSLIELALEHGARMLFTSTSEVYGDPLVHPQPESYFGNVNPIGPRACYDEGKRFGEAAMAVAISGRGLDGRIVRIFNSYGPRMDIGDGRLIPALFAAARDGRPFPIHGTGLQTRSMTYVDDLIAGLLAVQAWKPGGVSPVNLGSEEEYTVLEIAAAFAQTLGIELATVSLPARPEDPQRRKPVTSLARSIGWTAETTLREGLRRSYDWFRTEALQFA